MAEALSWRTDLPLLSLVFASADSFPKFLCSWWRWRCGWSVLHWVSGSNQCSDIPRKWNCGLRVFRSFHWSIQFVCDLVFTIIHLSCFVWFDFIYLFVMFWWSWNSFKCMWFLWLLFYIFCMFVFYLSFSVPHHVIFSAPSQPCGGGGGGFYTSGGADTLHSFPGGSGFLQGGAGAIAVSTYYGSYPAGLIVSHPASVLS